ncbi:hypothetical protein ACHMW6_00070 (plasmid) [Pseudoduganella sp. UC29_106]|uniref:hypothetical protein n=1 Tax=Pseudoduganella sp. UC29_106 TaxID=3374553 RepID=UPI003757F889
MSKRFNIFQTNTVRPGIVAKFAVIDGKVSPAGYPIGPHTEIKDGLSIEAARKECDRLNASADMPRRSEAELTNLIERAMGGDPELLDVDMEPVYRERLPYKAAPTSRDFQDAYPNFGNELDCSFIRDSGQYAIFVSGFYTAAELRAMLAEVERANAVWEPHPTTTC